MSTIIKSISFKNFYNYSGDYDRNTYVFTKGINIVNADNGMGKSKLYNGFLWILKNKVYDSDTRQPVDIMSSPLKVLSDQAKGSDEVTLETGVRLVYEDDHYQYSIEKTISFTRTTPNASFNNTREWRIGDIVTLVTKSSLNALSRPIIVYEVSEKDAIIRNLIVPAMQPYALLQGEAIDNIVDLSNSTTLTSTIETLTDLSSLNEIEKSCKTFTRNAKSDLSTQQRTQATNISVFENLAGRQKTLERQISEVEAQIETFKKELERATNEVTRLQSQLLNTGDRVKYQTLCKQLDEQIDEKNKIYLNRITRLNSNMFKPTMPWLLIGSGNAVQTFGLLRDQYTKARTVRQLASNPESFASILPVGSPDDVSLKKMLESHQCLVCGRYFEVDSTEEAHIQNLLSRSEVHTKAEESDIYLYFDSIQRNVASYMRTDSIFAEIANEIKEISILSESIKDLKKQRNEAEVEYFNYGGSKDSFNSDSDTNLIAKHGKARDDVRRYDELIKQSYKTLDEFRTELDKVERNISNLDGARQIPVGYINLRDAVMDAQQIFENTRKRIYDEVISKLETKSNEFYTKLTAGNNVMGGTMRFERTDLDTIEVKVLTNNGSELTGASEGFQRMKKIAVVMAIISSRLGGGRFMYPFIADAPFSAFGKNFINNFFDTVPDVFDQSIILIKDLYDVDNEQCLSEDGHKVLQQMLDGQLHGTFYVNKIPKEADPTQLSTDIQRYI